MQGLRFFQEPRCSTPGRSWGAAQAEGAPLRAFAQEMTRPAYLAIDDDSGRVFVSDGKDHVIGVFDMAGQLLFNIGESGNGDGQFYAPQGLAIAAGKLYVADMLNARIQYFDLQGGYLGRFGERGDQAGQQVLPIDGLGLERGEEDNQNVGEQAGVLEDLWRQGGCVDHAGGLADEFEGIDMDQVRKPVTESEETQGAADEYDAGWSQEISELIQFMIDTVSTCPLNATSQSATQDKIAEIESVAIKISRKFDKIGGFSPLVLMLIFYHICIYNYIEFRGYFNNFHVAQCYQLTKD